jgi:hypothetical protein
MFSEDGKPLKLPLFRLRGGVKIKGFSLLIRNRKLARILRAIVTAKRRQQKLRFLRDLFFYS